MSYEAVVMPQVTIVKSENDRKVIATSDFLTKLCSSGKLATPKLPLNTLEYSKRDKSVILVTEQVSTIREVICEIDMEDSRDERSVRVACRMLNIDEDTFDDTFKIDPEDYGINDDDSCYYYRFKIPTPRTVVFHALGVGNEGTYFIRGESMYALADPITDPDTPLYWYPLGNVFSSGAICWGSNERPAMNSLRALSSFADMFYGTPFNSDLDHSDNYRPFSQENTNSKTTLVICAVLNYRTQFPRENLARVDQGPNTYGSMLNKVFGDFV